MAQKTTEVMSAIKLITTTTTLYSSWLFSVLNKEICTTFYMDGHINLEKHAEQK